LSVVFISFIVNVEVTLQLKAKYLSVGIHFIHVVQWCCGSHKIQNGKNVGILHLGDMLFMDLFIHWT